MASRGRPRPPKPQPMHDRLLQLAGEVRELHGAFCGLHDEYLAAGEEPPFDLRTFTLRMKYTHHLIMKLMPEDGIPPPTEVFISELPTGDDGPRVRIARLRRVWSEERGCRVFESVPIHLRLFVDRIEGRIAEGEVSGLLTFTWVDIPP